MACSAWDRLGRFAPHLPLASRGVGFFFAAAAFEPTFFGAAFFAGFLAEAVFSRAFWELISWLNGP